MANETTWTSTAPSGVYKNHTLSEALKEAAAMRYEFTQFADTETAYGKKKGESVTLNYFKPLSVPADPSINESTKIPIEAPVMGGRTITVKEWGRGVVVSNLFEDLSKYNVRNPLQKRLIDQMTNCMDNACAAAYKTGKVIFTPASETVCSIDTDGTVTNECPADINLTVAHVQQIRDYMINNLHVPFYEKGSYICLATTRALRGIKGDATFYTWSQYLSKGDVFFNSEVGRFESIRFIETTTGVLSNAVGLNDSMGEAVFFGEAAVTYVEAEKPELRYNPNYNSDFGRQEGVAWYGICQFGTTFDTADDRLCRIIRFSSV